MNTRVTSIIEDARKLTPQEREKLLLRLQHEFADDESEGTPEEIEAAWVEEAERRIASAQRGDTTFISHEDGMAELRRLIAGS